MIIKCSYSNIFLINFTDTRNFRRVQSGEQWKAAGVSHFYFFLGCLIFPDLKLSSLVVSASIQCVMLQAWC